MCINCMFCGKECQFHRDADIRGGIDFYDCPSCGRYIFSYLSKMEMDGIIKENKHLISGHLYEFNRGKTDYRDLCGDAIKQLLKDGRVPQTNKQRIERFLLNLYKTDNTIGKTINVLAPDTYLSIIGFDGSDIHKEDISMSYAKDKEELYSMLKALVSLGYMTQTQQHYEYYYSITPKGFERAEQLMSTQTDSTSVFVAMWFGDEVKSVYEEAIQPAIEECGYRAVRVDKIEHNNDITDEIVVGIKGSKFVVADLTGYRGGVYFEAGYAKGLGKELILSCRKDWFDGEKDSSGKWIKEAVHFDLNHLNTIDWETPVELKMRLVNRINATVGKVINKVV